MFHAGDTIENPITGERIVFLQTAAETAGELVVVETFVQAGGFVAAAHVHPGQEERFQVLRPARWGPPAKRSSKQARATASPSAGTPHKFWNAGSEGGALRLRGEGLPCALRAAAGDDVRARRARQDEPERAAQPTPTGRDRTRIRRYGPLPFPPVILQRLGLALASPLGRLLGYEPLYTPPHRDLIRSATRMTTTEGAQA